LCVTVARPFVLVENSRVRVASCAWTTSREPYNEKRPSQYGSVLRAWISSRTDSGMFLLVNGASLAATSASCCAAMKLKPTMFMREGD
jgi:hypothetical protein